MIHRFSWSPSCLLILTLLVGCGSSAATSTPTEEPKPRFTSVPNVLVGYASLAEPTLKGSIQQATSLVRKMKSAKGRDFHTAADACSLAGGSIADLETSFRETYVPPKAQAIYREAYDGYKLVLSATEECGIAGDISKRKAMDIAIADMNAGLFRLKRAEAAVAPWFRS